MKTSPHTQTTFRRKKEKNNSGQFWILEFRFLSEPLHKQDFTACVRWYWVLIWNTVIKLNNELNSKTRFPLWRFFWMQCHPNCSQSDEQTNKPGTQTNNKLSILNFHCPSFMRMPFFSSFLFLWAISHYSYTSVQIDFLFTREDNDCGNRNTCKWGIITLRDTTRWVPFSVPPNNMNFKLQ